MIYKVPLYINNVWYNHSIWDKDKKYPNVFDKKGDYIQCYMGQILKMGETKCGKNIFYEVIEIWYTQGSDFYYPSDSLNCKMKFHSIN